MRIYKKLVQFINATNPEKRPLAIEDVVFSVPVVDIGATWNTAVIAQAVDPTKYTGQVTLRYRRAELSAIAAGISFIVPLGFTGSQLIAAINAKFNTALTEDDLEPIVLPVIGAGIISTVLLIAHPDSLGWLGQVIVSLLSSYVATPQTSDVLNSVMVTVQKVQSDAKDLSALQQTSMDLINAIQNRQTTNVAILQASVRDIQTLAVKIQTNIDSVEALADTQDMAIVQIRQLAASQALIMKSMESRKANMTDIRSIQLASRTNVSNHDMTLGQPCYSVTPTTVDLASAAFSDKKAVIGLVGDPLIQSQTSTGRIQTFGILTATVEQWVAATGMVGGLVPDKIYYLATEAGKITPYPPVDSALYICIVGRAISTKDFLIRIEQPIKL